MFLWVFLTLILAIKISKTHQNVREDAVHLAFWSFCSTHDDVLGACVPFLFDVLGRNRIDIRLYRVIALISVNIVRSWDMEGRELASVCRYPNEGQYSPIPV